MLNPAAIGGERQAALLLAADDSSAESIIAKLEKSPTAAERERAKAVAQSAASSQIWDCVIERMSA